MPFGQLVVGPPGAGKTTFCHGMHHYLTLSGRPAAVINLDPANDTPPYECAVDVRELVSFESVQTELGLGPNGALMYCMEHIAANADWLADKLAPLLAADTYLIFDCPGQAELLTSHDALQRLLAAMSDQWHIRLAVVHMVDSHLCADASKFLAALLLSLSCMLHLGLPHVNVLSKVDLIEAYGALPFDLEFYTRGGDARYLAEAIAGEGALRRHAKLTRGLCELVEDYGLVSFSTLDVQDEASMRAVVAVIDKANGAVFAGLARAAAARGDVAMPQMYTATQPEGASERVMDVQERCMPSREPGGL